MARPQVAEGRQLRIYLISKDGQQTKGRSSSVWVERGANYSHLKEVSLLRNITRSLGHGRIFWTNDLRERKYRDLVLGMLDVYIGQAYLGQWRKKQQNIS
jgi:hypothetical protein